MFITTTCISGLDSYNHRRRNAYNTTCSIRCIKTCLYITGLVRSLNGVSGHFSNISFEQLTSISLNLHYYECWMGPCQFILVGISTTGCVFLDGGPFVFLCFCMGFHCQMKCSSTFPSRWKMSSYLLRC